MTASDNGAFAAVVFDLDGTLADTLQDLADATNWGLSQLGFPVHPLPSYRYMVGAGRTELCRRALPVDRQDLVEKLATMMTDYYAKHCFDTTRPYPGIIELLRKLAGDGIKLAVLSNKPQSFVELTMKTLFGDFHFDQVLGDGPELPRKPDPSGALLIAKRLGIATDRFAYVGDTSIDMETANRAGMYAIGVSWGFRERQELMDSGAKVIVITCDELYEVIVGTKA